MAQPVISEFGQILYDEVAPEGTRQRLLDEAAGWGLLRWCDAFGSNLDEIYQIVKDRGAQPGYAMLLDPNQAPAREDALGWLAQFVGWRLVKGQDLDISRGEIAIRKGHSRGSNTSLVNEIQKTLVDQPGTITVIERYGGDPWQFRVGIKQRVNLVHAGSFESGTLEAVNWASSTSGVGDPAASFAPTQAWAKFGTWSARYQATRSDSASVLVRTPSGTGVQGLPVIPGAWYGGRVSVRIRVPSAGAPVLVMRIYWWRADGSACVPANSPDVFFPSPAAGVYEVSAVGQAPADAAFAWVGINFDSTTAYSVDADVDAFALYQVPAGTLVADVPEYVGPDHNGESIGAIYLSPSRATKTSDIATAIANQKPIGLISGIARIDSDFSMDAMTYSHTTMDSLTTPAKTFASLTANPTQD